MTKWLTQEIDIPRGLRELHGTRAPRATLLLTYLSAILCGGIVAWQLLRPEEPWWKALLAGLIFMDIGVGMVANFTASTRRYYREREKLCLPFLAAHVLHPLALAALFPTGLPYFLFAMLFTLASALVVNALKNAELQRNLAALLVVAGSALSFAFPQYQPVFYLFTPLFLLKLVLGFAAGGYESGGER